MEYSDNSSYIFEKFQSTIPDTPGSDASQSLISTSTTKESNSLGLFLQPTSCKNNHPPRASTFKDDGNVELITFSSSKINDTQFCELSGKYEDISEWRNVTDATDYLEHTWFNLDISLNYINNLLMVEESYDTLKLHHGESALRAMEEPFYRLLGQNHPAYAHQPPLLSCDCLKNLNDSTSKPSVKPCSCCSSAIDSHNNLSDNLQGSEAPWSLSAIVGERNTQDNKYITELGLNVRDLSISQMPSKVDPFVQVNKRDTSKHPSIEFEVQRRKSYPCREDFVLLEGRSNKQFAFSSDEPIRDEMFDKVLLYSPHKPLNGGLALQGTAATKATKNSQSKQGVIFSRRKIKGKEHLKKQVVDLRSLLTQCAEAVSVNNHTMARDILKTIRPHLSVTGDYSQRLVFYLADCLEVRLAGAGVICITSSHLKK